VINFGGMILPKIVEIEISKILTSKFDEEVRIFSFLPLSGGDINSAAKIESSHGNFFLKWNDFDRFPLMFQKEAKGLNLLREAKCIRIPEVIKAADAGDFSFLMLEFIETGSANDESFKNLGEGLARLHSNSQNYFGLDHDNYIGSLAQSNKKHEDWISFFAEERIAPQLRLAFDSNLIDKGVLNASERLFKVLSEIFPDEASALLHGDLWSGNYLMDDQANPCLIDPAIYNGHREMDIAMTKLFGGFSTQFYEAYNATFSLEKDWEKRVEICNLYPLLVHVNLFGSSYVQQVKSILHRF
jgi:protein-ribulosamine 3-kinase